MHETFETQNKITNKTKPEDIMECTKSLNKHKSQTDTKSTKQLDDTTDQPTGPARIP